MDYQDPYYSLTPEEAEARFWDEMDKADQARSDGEPYFNPVWR